MDENIINAGNWTIVYDSYGKPIIKSETKNVLLLNIKVDNNYCIVNNKLLLEKNKFIFSEGLDRRCEKTNEVKKWLRI